MSEFVVCDGEIKSYHGSRRIYNHFKIDDLLADQHLFSQVLESKYNQIEEVVDYESLTFREQAISISYLLDRKKRGEDEVIIHRNITSNEITSYYKFEVWIDMEGIFIPPGQYYDIKESPNEMVIAFEEKYRHLAVKQISAPWEQRIPAYLTHKSKIDRIIGIKRFKDTNWLATSRKREFNGEKSEVILDLTNFDNDVYSIFKLHEALDIKNE